MTSDVTELLWESSFFQKDIVVVGRLQFVEEDFNLLATQLCSWESDVS